MDQLDHVAPTGEVTVDENFALLSGGIESIDLSSALISGGTTFTSGLFFSKSGPFFGLSKLC